LSEAVAKANCVEEVDPKFVNEAYDLLRQSIVTVEKDDVEVDEDEEPARAANGDEDQEMADQVHDRDGDSPMRDDTEQQTQQERPKTKITWEKFNSIMNLILRRVHEDEQNLGEGVEQEDLVVWYLEQIENNLNTQEDYDSERSLAGKVLKRMVKVRIALPLVRSDMLTDDVCRTNCFCVSLARVSWIPKSQVRTRTRFSTSCTRTVSTKRCEVALCIQFSGFLLVLRIGLKVAFVFKEGSMGVMNHDITCVSDRVRNVCFAI
jgi:hypothetical protein